MAEETKKAIHSSGEAKAEKVEKTDPPPQSEGVKDVGAVIKDAAAAEEKAQALHADTLNAEAEAVANWDAVYTYLKALKLEHEHVEGAAIRKSKLWVVLASINTAEEE